MCGQTKSFSLLANFIMRNGETSCFYSCSAASVVSTAESARERVCVCVRERQSWEDNENDENNDDDDDDDRKTIMFRRWINKSSNMVLM